MQSRRRARPAPPLGAPWPRASLCAPLCALLCALLTSCLPLSEAPPDCFPQEGCPLNLTCEAGRCVSPPERALAVRAGCLSAPACVAETAAGGEVRACLILEQPQLLSAHALTLPADAAEVSLRAPLFDAPLRASLVVLGEGAACPESPEELRARGLDAACLAEEGCRLRLRRPALLGDEVRAGAGAPLALGFDQAGGQCFEASWGAPPPAERCDLDDNDCDGFTDEGLSCPSAAR